MKMTKEQVAELLLNMNEDCSNVEILIPGSDNWVQAGCENYVCIMKTIINDSIYRIKSNEVKEITLDLFDRVVMHKDSTSKGRINYVQIDTPAFRPYVVIGNEEFGLDGFNASWQLVED